MLTQNSLISISSLNKDQYFHQNVNENVCHSYVGSSKRFVWKKNDPQEKPIGKGFTSTIYKGLDLQKEDAVAVKIVPKQKQKLLASDNYYRALYRRLPKFPHPNILKMRDFIEDSQNFYIISDLYEGSDLVDYVLKFSPRSIPNHLIQMVLYQILQGVDHLHQHKFLHRDIKLDNILFKDLSLTELSIVDYDMSLMVDWPELPRPPKVPNEISIVGTRDYMAPEGYNGLYTEASDLWSVGVILYIFLDGHFPYDLSNIKGGSQMIKETLRKGIRFRQQVKAKYPLAVDLAKRLLMYDAKFRIKTAKEALNHPWFLQSMTTMYIPVASTTKSKLHDKENQSSKRNIDINAIIDSSYYTHISPTHNYCSNNPIRRWAFFPMFNKLHPSSN